MQLVKKDKNMKWLIWYNKQKCTHVPTNIHSTPPHDTSTGRQSQGANISKSLGFLSHGPWPADLRASLTVSFPRW